MHKFSLAVRTIASAMRLKMMTRILRSELMVAEHRARRGKARGSGLPAPGFLRGGVRFYEEGVRTRDHANDCERELRFSPRPKPSSLRRLQHRHLARRRQLHDARRPRSDQREHADVVAV